MEYSKEDVPDIYTRFACMCLPVLWFFILFSLTDKWLYRNAGVQFSVGNMEIGNVGALPDSASAEVEDSIFMFDKSYPVFDNQEDFDRYLDTLSTEDQPGWMVRALMRKAMTMAGANNEELATQFRDTFLQAIPKALFFLIPVFALFLRLLYLRSPYFYEEHLVFGLHFHTFLFIAILIFTWLGALSLWCWFLFPVLITWYFWRASMSLCAVCYKPGMEVTFHDGAVRSCNSIYCSRPGNYYIPSFKKGMPSRHAFLYGLDQIQNRFILSSTSITSHCLG